VLYVGIATTKEDKDDTVAKAKALNPKFAIFRATRDANSRLIFNPI
jgi:hypothetical protein